MTRRGHAGPSIRLHQLLLAVGLAVPVLLAAAAAWQNHADVTRESGATILRTAAVMQEHARKVFETVDLAIGQVNERVDDLDDAALAGAATADFLRRLRQSMDQVVSIAITDAAGTVRASSGPDVPNRSLAGTDLFRRVSADPAIVVAAAGDAEADSDAGAAILAAPSGAAPDAFTIARRRTTPDGHFAGMIQVAVSSRYFAGFYAKVAPRGAHSSMLLRADGAILARDPAVPGLLRLPPDSRLLPHMTEGGGDEQLYRAMALDGVTRDYAIGQVGTLPVFVVFAVPLPVVMARWHANLVNYGLVAALAAATLVLVSWLALRGAVAEQLALGRLRAEIAQREAAEDRLRHAQRMDAVGQLTGGVAHDFNNLLTAILGSLELIGRAAGRPDGKPRIDRLTETAIKAVQRGSVLTKSLLAFSRRQPLQPVTLDANALLADFIDFLQQAVGVGIGVTFAPSPDLPPCIADPAELQGALLNLAINARDAMPDGGRLSVVTEPRDLAEHDLSGNGEARPGRFAAIVVADSGTGMPPEVAAKAFEPFFTTKPIGQGTGLGLSQVFGFVRQLGGHVTIGTPVGGGTAVTLFLPAATRTGPPDA